MLSASMQLRMGYLPKLCTQYTQTHDKHVHAYAAAIELASKDGIDWILHIDTDELMYPGGGAEYSIQRVLASVPADVDTLVFPNYESLPERDDVQDPFTEVGSCACYCTNNRLFLL